jgi:hypothetical protein
LSCQHGPIASTSNRKMINIYKSKYIKINVAPPCGCHQMPWTKRPRSQLFPWGLTSCLPDQNQLDQLKSVEYIKWQDSGSMYSRTVLATS